MKIHERPVFCVCLFLALNILLAFLVSGLKLGQSTGVTYTVYSIRFDYYGVDSAVMERQITIPLEERVAGMEGLVELTSVSEYGSCTTTASFTKEVDSKRTYLALRDTVDTLYRTMPPVVQKPRIYRNSAKERPVFSAAAFSAHADVDALRAIVDRDVKKKLEGIDGVAEVIVAGGHLEEVAVLFDGGRLASGGLNPDALSAVIRDANVVSPGALITGAKPGFHRTLAFNTRLKNLGEMRDLPVVVDEGKVTALGYLSEIITGNRSQEEIVKINGTESVVVHLKAASDANIIGVCGAARAVLGPSSDSDIIWEILYDDGSFLLGLLKNLGIAILQSFILVVLIIPVFFPSRRIVFLIVLLLPVSIFWTFAFLRAAGFSLDQNGLSGISIALGLIADSALVVSEAAEKEPTRADFLRKNAGLAPSIIASTATTLVSLVPLYFLESIVPGIRSTAVTIAAMLSASLVVTVVFLPAFLHRSPAHSGAARSKNKARSALKKIALRLVYSAVNWSVRHAGFSRFSYGVLAALPILLFCISGKDITMEAQGATLKAYVEFAPEFSPDAVDRDCRGLQESLRALKGVRFVSAEARKGNLELTIGYDENAGTRRIFAKQVASLSSALLHSTGFFYVPDSDDTDAPRTKKGRLVQVEIAVVGDEAAVCRDKAKQAAALIGDLNNCIQVVLNFKDSEEIYRFTPDPIQCLKAGVTAAGVAESLRWMIFGPVADKWIQNGKEMDIRVIGKKAAAFSTLADVEKIYVGADTGPVRLLTLGTLEKGKAQGKIYRKDARRAAYLTATMESFSSDALVAEIRNALMPLSRLGSGNYGVSLSRDFEDMASQYRNLVIAFVLSVAGILILLTALSENLRTSLAVVSLIPVSASLPLLISFLARRPITMGDITGLVVLGGIAVNNGIYISESPKESLRARVRDKVRSLAATSLTTIAGAIPLLLFGAEGFSRSLSYFMLWGTAGSAAASLCLFPGFLTKREGKTPEPPRRLPPVK